MKRREFVAGAAGLALTAGTGPVAAQPPLPRDFVWGASTSAFQIEGALTADGRGASVWDAFMRRLGPEMFRQAELACDHYRRFAEDFDLLARGGFGAYRFSVAWPRVMPEGRGPINPRGLDFYDRLVDALLERRIEPWACLYHWDLPQALQEVGGWLDRDIKDRFTDYGLAVLRRLGDRVGTWIMLNENATHSIFGHGLGLHAPGLRGRRPMLTAMHHQNLAQGEALRAFRAEAGRARLGTVICSEPVRPSSPSEPDALAARHFDAVWNRACLDPLLLGRHPDLLEAEFAAIGRSGDLAIIHQPVDFLGLNYYGPLYVQQDEHSPLGADFGPLPPDMRQTPMGWPIDADAFTEQLLELKTRYGNPAIHITENGIGTTDGDARAMIEDTERVAFLQQHLRVLAAAIANGVDVRGYFVWSLLDAIEWAEGRKYRFGVVQVNWDDMSRTPRASYRWLSRLIREG